MKAINTFLAVGLMSLTSLAAAHQHQTSMTIEGDKRCFKGNGLPNHGTGQFPNRGNPNRISEQNIHLCVDANPIRLSVPNMNHRGSVGIALNGVQLRPATADYYDPNSPRGFSKDRSSGWNLEGIGARDMLGMDHNNAHVDKRGLYHYHSMADAIAPNGNSLVGYAADGFEIHYAGNAERSSYQLRSGTRATAPGGEHDGTYVEDWVYQSGSGTLDQCNGTLLNGKFVYFATDTYPFFPRCFWGNVSNDFSTRRGHDDKQAPQFQPNHTGQPPHQNNADRRPHRRTPPAAAINACQNQSTGDSCQFETRRGHTRNGICRQTPSDIIACRPNRRH